MALSTHIRRLTCALLALVLACSTVSVATGSEEAELARLEAEADALVGRIEEAAATYAAATTEVDDLAARIAENEQRSSEIASALPAQRERTAASVKSMYLLQQSSQGLLGLILSSEDFDDFIATMSYLSAVTDNNTRQIQALCELTDSYDQTQAALAAELEAATSRQSDALYALEDMRQARADLQAQTESIRAAAERRKAADARAAAEAEAHAREAEQAAAQVVADLGEQEAAVTAPPTQSAPQTPEPTPTEAAPAQTAPETATQPPAEQKTAEQQEATQGQETSQRQVSEEPTVGEPAAEETRAEESATEEPATEVAPAEPAQTVSSADAGSWAARIDAYLAGSPLAGYGSVFADAAAQYGVDPRLSPAISCIESGKGSVCFRPHNAWGWGSSGWSSWDEAIRAHVSGFASLYGSTITVEGAKLYAGTDIYLTWYNLVQSEMSSI